MQRQLSSSSGDDRNGVRFSLSFTPSPPLLHFQCPLPPRFALSHYQGIILSARVYPHRYPLCSPFRSALLSPHSSLISLVLSLISIKKGIFLLLLIRFSQAEVYG